MVLIESGKVWEVFQKEMQTPGVHMREIANNPDTGVVIFLSTVGESGEKYPDILVCVDDDAFYEETCFDAEGCSETVAQIYKEYLSDKIDLDFGDEEFDDEMPEEDESKYEELESEAREDELDASLYDFLYSALDGAIDEFQESRESEFFKDCKEHFLEYLALKWECEIYRPMYLEDENGEVTYEIYPYTLLEFDDADDPIYFNS